jgi:hypothetical protein
LPRKRHAPYERGELSEARGGAFRQPCLARTAIHREAQQKRAKARRPRYTASDRMPLTLTHEGAPRRCSRGRSSFALGRPAARARAPFSHQVGSNPVR